jgi:hypothetical protein
MKPSESINDIIAMEHKAKNSSKNNGYQIEGRRKNLVF